MLIPKKLKLGSKMALGIGFISIVLISIIIFSYFSMRSNRSLFNELNLINQEADKAGRIQANFLTCRLSINTLLLNKDFSQKTTYEKRMTTVLSLITEFKAIEDEAGHLILLSNIEENIKEYDTEVKRLFSYESAIMTGKESEYLTTLNLQLEEMATTVSSDIESFKLSLLSQENNIDNRYMYNINIATILMFIFTLFGAIVAVIIGVIFTRLILNPIKVLTYTFSKISQGDADMSVRLPIESDDEIGEMSTYFNTFIEKLAIIFKNLAKENEIKNRITEIDELTRGDMSLKEISNKIIKYACSITNSNIGAVYVKNEGNEFILKGTYSQSSDDREIATSELKNIGISNSAITEKSIKIINNLPKTYFKIQTGLGETTPKNIAVIPCIVNDEVICVLEIGSLNDYSNEEIHIFNSISQVMAIGISTSLSREKINDLYHKTLQQTEELQVQQEELMQSHEELMEQTNELIEKENLLQTQQEELKVTNSVLEEKNISLQQQQKEIINKNNDLENAKSELTEKANALMLSNKYKSEFLANVSHELKTPLNSIMVLSELLACKNDNLPLSSKEVEYARTIHNSGAELLALIMDILDLSKVEAGKIDLNPEIIEIKDLIAYVNNSFGEIADKKKLSFKIHSDSDKLYVNADEMRLKQIIKNMLSNAIKFTEKGSIELEISKKSTSNGEFVDFKVKDTGIGIEQDKLDLIFEAFKQANGTINRKYGGTGLGLSISKQLANIMGGDLTVSSKLGEGSTFCLTLPQDFIQNHSDNIIPIVQNLSEYRFNDDVSEFTTKNNSLGTSHKIINIKNDKIITKSENESLNQSKVDVKNILVVGEYDLLIENAFQNDTRFEIISATTFDLAYSIIERQNIDCIILEKHIGDVLNFEFLDKLYKKEKLSVPVIVYTDNVISIEEEEHLLKYSNSIIIKGAKSIERLLSEVEEYTLKTDVSKFSRTQNLVIDDSKTDDRLSGTKVLIVDDDVRNIFSITGILESKGMNVVVARNGRDGIDKFSNQPDIELILMDIMMPIIDGYETIREIRSSSKGKNVPIIAITAKSMAEDRVKCIEAGANDYTTKPVNIEKLISLIRVWLSK